MQVTSINGMGSIVESSPGVFDTEGMKAEDHMHISADYMDQAGIVRPSDFVVTERGAGANRSVDVSAGTAYVLNHNYSNNSLSQTRFWRVVNGATVNATLTTNTSGNPRIDLICLFVDTGASPNDDADNVASILVVEGTPAGSPTAPAVPDDCLVLAQVLLADSYTSVTNANITDRRLAATLSYPRDEWHPVFGTVTRTGDHSFTVVHDRRDEFRKGAKLRYQDGGSDEYGVVGSNSYSSGTNLTTVNLIVNTDYSMAAATITDVYISYSENPEGFPLKFMHLPVIQRGWGFVTGDGNPTKNTVVTFPVPFIDRPMVSVTAVGFLDGSDPANLGSFGTWEEAHVVARVTNNSSMIVSFNRTTGANIPSGRRLGFAWIAMEGSI